MDTGKVLKSISEHTGIQAFVGNDVSLEVENIPFHVPQLDRAIGGGIPRGRITEVFGDFSTGKTTLTQYIIRSAQEMNLGCVYFNAENKYDPRWFEATGVDTSRVVVVQGNLGEPILDATVDLIKSDIGMVVIDSVASLIPISEEKASIEQDFIGLQARMLTQGFRKITHALSTSKTALILINQMRSSIGAYMGGDKPPGGKAQFFFASLCLHIRRGEWMEEVKKDVMVRKGFHIKVRTTKNTLAAPWQEADVPFYFTGNIDLVASFVGLAMDFGIVEKTGSWLTFGDKKIQGVDNMNNFFRENKEEFKELVGMVSGVE